MKAIQKLKNHFKNLIRKPLVKCSEESVGVTTRQKEPRPQRRRAAGTPCPKSTLQVAFSDSVSEKHLNGDSSCATDFVLRHGLFLSLYSILKKASGKLPWRSRTNNNSGFSSSSSNYSLSGTRNYIKNFRRIRILGSASLFSLGLLLLATFVPLYNVTRTEDTEAAAGTAQDSSITFTATRSTASVDLTVTDENGTFASSTSSNQAAFSLSTTNYTGYTLTIASNNNTSALTNTNGGTLSSISSPIDESTFNTTTYNNKWGYKPNYYGSAANTNYRPSPTTTADTLDETSSANSTAKNYTIALGARADYTNASGTYSSSNYKLMYVANPVAYSISFDKGSAADNPSNMPAIVTGSVSALSVNLPNTVPTRTAYDFIGWCLGNITTTNNVDTCSNVNVYNPNGNGTNLAFGIDRESDSTGVILHAMWKIKTYTITRRYRLQDTSGNYPSSYTADGTVTVDYGGSYTYSCSATTSHQAASTSISNVTSAQTISLDVPRKTITVTKQYRKQDTSGNYPNTYTSDGTASVLYGANYTYSRAAETGFQAASKTITNVTSAQTIQLDVPRTKVTCNKRYRLQNANDTNYGSYTSDGSTETYYGGSCSYSKTITDYNSNNAKSISASNVTSTTTLSLDFPRNTYKLTVTAGSNTSSATGGGTYRWGQTVTVGVTKATNVTCTTYATPTWTATAGTAPSAGTSVSYTMPKSAATVTATSAASNVAQTVTLSRSTGASSIKIGSTNYTSSSVSLNCGTYNISGNYSTNYEFSSWSRANGVAVANTSSASTTMTVNGAGTLTLNAKQSCVAISGTMQAFTGTGNYCGTSGTLTDLRDNNQYLVAKLADGKWWMLDNLRLGGTSTISLTTANSNTNGNFTLPAGITSRFDSYTVAQINVASKNTVASTKYGSGSGKIGVYYNYCAVSAGTYCMAEGSGSYDASYDICPKGWRMPTGGSSGEYKALYTAYSSNATDFMNALSTPLSGLFVDSSALNQGSSGNFWSSTYGSYGMYSLSINSSNVYPISSSGRGQGYTVRCILK